MKSFERGVISWAEARPDIRAILVVGSTARRDHPADEWSDLDLLIFTTDLDRYLTELGDIAEIGNPWVSVHNAPADDFFEYLVLFDDGQKVDFGFFPISRLESLAQSQDLPNVYQRGYYVLLDKDGLAAKVPPSPFSAPKGELPPAYAFTKTVNAFWYMALKTAKQIRRRELWLIKKNDTIMKEHLLRMIEWHARAHHGIAHDTWHDGRFMWEWTDEQTWITLFAAFAHFDAADSWRALITTMDLFRRLATETAQSCNFDYPVSLDTNITTLLNQWYSQDIDHISRLAP
jgi:aminoglycoside 6-adenylyltransferase